MSRAFTDAQAEHALLRTGGVVLSAAVLLAQETGHYCSRDPS